MRRIKTFWRGEVDRGATAILVAFLLTGLLGFAGLAIDLGASYAKHTELQTGADAAALALAQEYAFEDDPCGAARASGEAKGWVEVNVRNDEAAAQALVRCDDDVASGLEENQLQVVADTRLDHWFMPVVGKKFSDLSADATVEFGVPGTIVTTPVAIADCALPSVEELETGTQVVIWFPTPSASAGGNPKAPEVDVCAYHNELPPGGFSLIQHDGECNVEITVPLVTLPSGTGASELKNCFGDLIGELNYVPIFDGALFAGNNGELVITQFAAIRLDLISFTSKKFGLPGVSCTGERPPWTHQKQDNCLVGVFEGLVSIDDVIGDDLVMPDDDDTAIVVRLID